jgi:hypothetical protein
MDQAIHGDDVIENPVLAIQHVTHFVDDAACRCQAFASLTCNFDERGRNINRQNLRTTPRCLYGEAARATTGIKKTLSGQVIR